MESKIQVPLIRNPESSSLNPEPPLIPEFKIVLDYLTWGDGSPPPGGGGGGGLLSYIQGLYPFLNKKFKYFTFPIFQGLHQCKKSALSLCIC